MNNQFDIQGEIFFLGQEEKISATFSKVTVVLKIENGTRIEYVPFDFLNPTNVFNGFKVGHHAHISFKLRGNRHKTDNTKFFPSNEGLSISKI